MEAREKRDSALAHIYLVKGDDSTLVDDRASEVVKAISDSHESSIELISAYAGDDDLSILLAEISQCFMFAAAGVFLVREISKVEPAQITQLCALIEAGIDYNYLILTTTARVPAALQTVCEQSGEVIDVALRNDRDRKGYIDKLLRSSSFTLSSEASSVLMMHLGQDMGRLGSILAVLGSRYPAGSNLDSGQLMDYLGAEGEIPLWSLSDVIERGDSAGAVEVLRRFLYELDKPPMLLLSVLNRRFIELGSVASPSLKSAAQVNEALMAVSLKSKPPFVVKKMMESAQKLGFDGSRKAFSWLGETERMIKGGSTMDEGSVLELCVARLATLFRKKQQRSDVGVRQT